MQHDVRVGPNSLQGPTPPTALTSILSMADLQPVAAYFTARFTRMPHVPSTPHRNRMGAVMWKDIFSSASSALRPETLKSSTRPEPSKVVLRA